MILASWESVGTHLCFLLGIEAPVILSDNVFLLHFPKEELGEFGPETKSSKSSFRGLMQQTVSWLFI